jgi:hypothetical protein
MHCSSPIPSIGTREPSSSNRAIRESKVALVKGDVGSGPNDRRKAGKFRRATESRWWIVARSGGGERCAGEGGNGSGFLNLE